MQIPAECKVMCFCQQKHMQMPPIVNPQKQDTAHGTSSPFGNNTFNMSGFNQTYASKHSEQAAIADSLVQMCEHAKTNNV